MNRTCQFIDGVSLDITSIIPLELHVVTNNFLLECNPVVSSLCGPD